MATLVLTVVGGLVGGPVGAAIGASAGQQIDAAIFKPKGREGPRLADLKVQASTYGQQIPRLYGTMRVAGSVIWATDLIERRSRHGGGKGRPSTTEYSYAVSLAIALSSRRILAIRRIWADGNLLRGTSGSFQERCIFRWYDGGDDQPVDPLVASAVGPASASGFRGLAYAVFEELELASFGNRIPSLTFEVEADTGPVDSGLIGDDLLGEAGRCGGFWPFAGYAASGDRARDAVLPLFEADATGLQTAPGNWRLAPVPAASEAVPLAGFGEARRLSRDIDCIERRRGPLSALPGAIRLRHYEPARDYQLGQQAVAVPGGGAREDRIDLPAALSAGSARALAAKLASAAADGRETLVWQGDLAALALAVGTLVTAADGGIWRLAARTVRGDDITIELRRHQPVSTTTVDADPGVPVTAPDWPDADATIALFDLSNIDGVPATVPRLIVAAAGSNDGWRGADLWFVAAPGAEPVPMGPIRPASALGVLSEPLTAGSSALIDEANAIMVRLANPSMTLESVEDRVLFGGANRAMVGGELLQFGTAEALGDGLWRLGRLLRGRCGTEGASSHAPGTAFVLIDDPALFSLPGALATAAEGGTALLQWAPRNGVTVTGVAIPAAGRALVPLAPVHGRLTRDAGGGIMAEWIRRSRADTGWRDHIDLPVGEARELWRVEIDPPVTGITGWDCPAPALHLDAATLALLPPGRSLSIRQIGDFAVSPPLLLPID